MRWFSFLFQKQLVERQLDKELRFHLEQQVNDYIAAGMTPDQARRKARLDFGGLEQIKEECRDTRPDRWIEDLARDLRYGMRMLRRSPGFTTLAVLTLGIALASSAVMFSIIDGVLLLPLPYRDSGRLARIYSTTKTSNVNRVVIADYLEWARRSRSFEGLAAIETDSNAALTDGDFPEEIVAMHVSPGFFRLLGTRAALGRLLQDQDFAPDRKYDFNQGYSDVYANSVAVLSHRLWQGRYGGDPDLIGRTISILGRPVTVVGITPADFQFSEGVGQPTADCWIPRVYRETDYPYAMLMVIGRIKKDSSLRQAQAELDVIAQGIAAARPKTNKGKGTRLVSLHETIVGRVRRQLLVLFGAVACLLLIACANIANLLLARAGGRQREMSVRAAVGASRRRLIRQLLTESILLCLFGGFVGVLLALSCKDAVIALAPRDLPRLDEIVFDVRAFGFTFLVALLTGFLCGLIPALRASGTDFAETLKDGASLQMTRSRRWFACSLVTAQVSLAFLLLIASGLMIRTYIQLHAVPLGFDFRNIVVMNARPSNALLRSWPQRGHLDLMVKYHEELTRQVQEIPGVECAAMGALPLRTGGISSDFQIEGRQGLVECNSLSTTPDYFRVIGAQLLAGRFFNAGDRRDTPAVAAINQAAAQKLWPGANPIGKRMGAQIDKTFWIEVVGLVGDVRMSGLEGPPVPIFYIPMSQSLGTWPGRVLVRTKEDPEKLIPSFRRALQKVDKDAPLGKVETLEQILDSFLAVRRFNLFLISVFGGLAFLLATIGIYGTTAYSVSRRTHEIGIRMALGAQQGDVLRLVIMQGLWMLLIGEAVGLAGALALNRLLSSMVFGITTTDKVTYVTVSLTWAAVAIFASYLPARKAILIDPLQALRCE